MVGSDFKEEYAYFNILIHLRSSCRPHKMQEQAIFGPCALSLTRDLCNFFQCVNTGLFSLGLKVKLMFH